MVMKNHTIYLVVQPQLCTLGETNGWKDVHIYHIVGSELASLGSLEILLQESSEEAATVHLLESGFISEGEDTSVSFTFL